MLRRKIAESLTVRIFLITAFILFCAGAVTFGLIAWATPMTYTAVINDDLTRQTEELADRLENSVFEDWGALLDDFIRSSGADIMLTDSDGQMVDTGSRLAVQSFAASDEVAGEMNESIFTYAADGKEGTVTVTMSGENSIVREVQVPDRKGSYFLSVIPRVEAENLAVQALVQMAPWLVLMLLVFSLLCALVYSRYITRPIVRLSGIAGKMAELDFNWRCGEGRRDEIGTLGRSLNQMSRKLSAALEELEAANHALRGEMEQERELDRQRMAFFSAASHELKTPLTILKGQLSGMLEGVDVYQDRDKYLLRSLQVTGRMEKLIQEMMMISRMETEAVVAGQKPVVLSDLLKQCLDQDGELLKLRGQQLVTDLTPGITVVGDASLLEKAIGNLLSNASMYSPDGGEIRLWCGKREGCPAFSVENTGVHIGEEALPHLFEAFYREDHSRSRRTGGSGLGLYLVRIILEKHGAKCHIENTADGVRATVCFDGCVF